MFHTLLAACGVALGITMTVNTGAFAIQPSDKFLTVAERSEYKATARHAEVIELFDRLADASHRVHRTTVGQSGEGREIPAVIIAEPPVTSPAEAAAQIRDHGKLVVMAIGNIHAGEVCGKEALGMLTREIAFSRDHPLLRDLIIIVAPIYNADGNERVAKDNRPGQVGPEEGMGRRPNAAGLDLNRDFIKMEAPETQALIGFMNKWDPSVIIDTHTTNGSLHRYLITYEGPKTPAGNARLIEFTRDTMFPEITRLADEGYNVPTYFYGNFNSDHTRWTTYEATARFGTSYIGLRNRISILTEAYSYAPYKDRVIGTRDFVRTCFDYAAAEKETIHRLLADIDAETMKAGRDPKPDDLVALRTRVAPAPGKVTVAGQVGVESEYGGEGSLEPRDFEVELWNRFEATHTVTRPVAYLVPNELSNIIEKLRQHGVQLDRLDDNQELEVEIYRIEAVTHADREFQKHRIATVEATPRRETRTIDANTYTLIRTAQPLGNLVVYLLEPECEDGLTAWNYFDENLIEGKDFPIQRVTSPIP